MRVIGLRTGENARRAAGRGYAPGVLFSPSIGLERAGTLIVTIGRPNTG